MEKKMNVFIGLSAIAAIWLLAACGSAATPTPAAPPPTTAPPTATTEPTAVPPTVAPTETAAPTAAPTVAPTEAAAPTAAPTVAPTETASATVAAPSGTARRPSNAGAPGEAISLTGDATAGQAVYDKGCKRCHGDAGKGGNQNSGSESGVIPALNPIASDLKDPDPKAFATNIDLFIEHGSTPKGTNPDREMPGYGPSGRLTQQQIADVIAYIISLNK